MKTIVGSIARESQFYPRLQLRAKILKRLNNNENPLISAPRRTGKSSIIMDLVDRPDDNFYAVYVDTEAITSSEDFFRLLLQAILDTDKIEKFGKFNKSIKDTLKSFANRISSINIGPVNLNINNANDFKSYYDEFIKFIKGIHLGERKILLLVDEFPITIENINESHGVREALLFLGQNRQIRLDADLKSRVSFIYTGSIGLITAVKRIDGTDKVNDLSEIHIPPLNADEASDFITKLYEDECLKQLTDETIKYILEKIEWWIPFYFQILIRELGECDHDIANKNDIDTAFYNVVKNGNIYFEHFKSRLKRVFRDAEKLKAVNEILVQIKNNHQSNHNQLLNIAERYNCRNDLNEIIEILKHDGYIVEQDYAYKFYSPILKQWWQ